MKAVLREIAVHLPERVVTNTDLGRENPSWDMAAIEAKAGVESRRIAGDSETALDLSIVAVERLLDKAGLPRTMVDGVICCTQSPDYVMPSNSHLLHRALRLPDSVLAFDFNLACSGYVYGTALAASLIESGFAENLILVTADTYSKHIHPKDRSARVLFGDGAAASLFSKHGTGGRVVGAQLCSRGRDFDKFMVPAGGQRWPVSAATKVETTDRHGNTRCAENIHMDGLAVWSFVNSAVPPHVNAFLAARSLTLSDVDLFVFHQASRMTIESLTRVLGIPAEKVHVSMTHTGNLVSASIPAALADARQQGVIPNDATVLLCGFGVGLSYGSVLLRYDHR